MDEIKRIVDIISHCQEFLADWKHWSDPNSGRPPGTDAQFWQKWENCRSTFRGGMRSGKIEEISRILEGIEAEVLRQEQANSEPADIMWGLLESLDEKVVELLDPREPAPMETIEKLMKMEGMSQDQVARMNGFLNRDGSGDISRLFRVIEDPKLLEGHRTPTEKIYDQKKELADQVNAMMMQERDLSDDALDEVIHFNPIPASELGDPVEPDVSAEDAIKLIDISILRNICAKAGIETKPTHRKKVLVKMLDESVVNWQDEVLALQSEDSI